VNISIVNNMQYRSHCALWICCSELSRTVIMVDERWNFAHSHTDDSL